MTPNSYVILDKTVYFWLATDQGGAFAETDGLMVGVKGNVVRDTKAYTMFLTVEHDFSSNSKAEFVWWSRQRSIRCVLATFTSNLPWLNHLLLLSEVRRSTLSQLLQWKRLGLGGSQPVRPRTSLFHGSQLRCYKDGVGRSCKYVCHWYLWCDWLQSDRDVIRGNPDIVINNGTYYTLMAGQVVSCARWSVKIEY